MMGSLIRRIEAAEAKAARICTGPADFSQVTDAELDLLERYLVATQPGGAGDGGFTEDQAAQVADTLGKMYRGEPDWRDLGTTAKQYLARLPW